MRPELRPGPAQQQQRLTMPDLDARKGDHGWTVFDVARCARVEAVIWVRPGPLLWSGWRTQLEMRLFRIEHGTLSEPPIHRENKITVYPERRLVLFNEVDDTATDELAEVHHALPHHP